MAGRRSGLPSLVVFVCLHFLVLPPPILDVLVTSFSPSFSLHFWGASFFLSFFPFAFLLRSFISSLIPSSVFLTRFFSLLLKIISHSLVENIVNKPFSSSSRLLLVLHLFLQMQILEQKIGSSISFLLFFILSFHPYLLVHFIHSLPLLNSLQSPLSLFPFFLSTSPTFIQSPLPPSPLSQFSFTPLSLTSLSSFTRLSFFLSSLHTTSSSSTSVPQIPKP